MHNVRIAVALAVLVLLGVGCETTETSKKDPRPQQQKEQQPPKKRKQTAEEKKRKSMRDPVADMLSIKRKESKPFVSESDALSEKEREAFSSSWSSQFKEAEEIHRKVRNQHEKDKKKSDSWVFFD